MSFLFKCIFKKIKLYFYEITLSILFLEHISYPSLFWVSTIPSPAKILGINESNNKIYHKDRSRMTQGAIDGKHVRIQNYPNAGSMNFN